MTQDNTDLLAFMLGNDYKQIIEKNKDNLLLFATLHECWDWIEAQEQKPYELQQGEAQRPYFDPYALDNGTGHYAVIRRHAYFLGAPNPLHGGLVSLDGKKNIY